MGAKKGWYVPPKNIYPIGELTNIPQTGKGKSSSNVPLVWDMYFFKRFLKFSRLLFRSVTRAKVLKAIRVSITASRTVVVL